MAAIERASPRPSRSLHVGEVAREQPGRKCANEVPGAFHPQSALTDRLREREGSRPDAGHRPCIGTDHEIDLVPGILQADVRPAALEDEPARPERPAAGREGAKVEPHDDAAGREPLDVDPNQTAAQIDFALEALA